MQIGFIGFGEAAFNISVGLREEGVRGIIAFDTMAKHEIMGKLIESRSKEAGVTLCPEARQAVEGADLLFVAVPSSYCLEVAREVHDYLKPGQQYVDVSAATPGVKRLIWDAVRDTGVLFTDAAMLGSLPQDKHRVPITASGTGAHAFHDAMTPFGMCITCLDADAGAASAIKLIRSIYMKGVAALMLEMLQAADAYGVCDDLVQSIANSFDGIPFRDHLNRLVTGTAIHAGRRAAELKGSIQMLEEADIDAAMTIAAKHRHELLEGFRFNEVYAIAKPKGYQEIIERLRPVR